MLCYSYQEVKVVWSFDVLAQSRRSLTASSVRSALICATGGDRCEAQQHLYLIGPKSREIPIGTVDLAISAISSLASVAVCP